MRPLVVAVVVVIVAIVAAPEMPASAQAQPDVLRVATRILPPFVYEEHGHLTGFSIELWEELATQLGVRTEYVVEPTLSDLLDATRTGQADLAIAAISITEERERTGDFSQPMFDAGLQILSPEHGAGIAGILDTIVSRGLLAAIAFMVIGALVVGHIVWFFERRVPDGSVARRAYYPGVIEATFWASSALATQAEAWPKSAASRLVSVIWMFTGLVFIAYFTATVTSALTVQQLRSDIQGPEDLRGRRVATVQSSTAAQYLAQRNLVANEFPTADEAIRSVERGESDAVVYDAPVLQYHAAHEGKGKVQVVGPVFRKESYGIQFPNGSPLRKSVNEALLRLRENGTYDRLLTRWFGGEGGRASG
jgi:polar amino acid transport system substrate-binding protein